MCFSVAQVGDVRTADKIDATHAIRLTIFYYFGFYSKYISEETPNNGKIYKVIITSPVPRPNCYC